MHPVLKVVLEPVAILVSPLTLEIAQVHPLPGHERWCVQQIMEHLMLTYRITSDSVNQQMKTGRVLKNRRNTLEFFLRVQTIGFGYMPDGVPAMRAVRPKRFTPQDGAEIAQRFLQAAEAMDEVLVIARKKFGIQSVGEHPFFGVMRVDEWRRYHAVHAKHHMVQLKAAIRFAKNALASGSELPPAKPVR